MDLTDNDSASSSGSIRGMVIPEIKQIRFNLWPTIPLYTHANFVIYNNSDDDFLKEIFIISCLQIHTISTYPMIQNCKKTAILHLSSVPL